MRAYRHRLIFWPLFCGFVVFFLSGKGMYCPFWPIVYAMVATVFVCAAIYSLDPERYRSRTVRLVLILTGLFIAPICWLPGDVAGCGITILFFLCIFTVPLMQAERRARKASSKSS